MSVASTDRQLGRRSQREMIRATRRGVVDRLGDPYLTEHDRWVLGQFARFLGGETPGPDPRAARPRGRTPEPAPADVAPARAAPTRSTPDRTLYARVRRATL